MNTVLTYKGMYTPGVDRYIIVHPYGLGILKTIPDLMRTRYYFNSRPFVMSTFTLPMLGDIIEYDYRAKEWFILNKNLISRRD